MRGILKVIILACVVMTFVTSGIAVTSAQEENVGLLRVDRIEHPVKVAPSSSLNLTVDIKYAVRTTAKVKCTVLNGSLNNTSSILWNSEPKNITGGGDIIWPITVTAPPTSGPWRFTILASYWTGAGWQYFKDQNHGPSFKQVTVETTPLARLKINLGLDGLPIEVDNSTLKTASNGTISSTLALSKMHVIAVRPTVDLGNGTRLVFVGWRNGDNKTQRSLLLTDDTVLSGSYRIQYLLTLKSTVAALDEVTWFNAGSNASLIVPSTVTPVPFSRLLGIEYRFQGWSGEVTSKQTAIRVSMNRPVTLTANYSLDYRSIAIPIIVLSGILSGAIFSIRRYSLGSSREAKKRKQFI